MMTFNLAIPKEINDTDWNKVGRLNECKFHDSLRIKPVCKVLYINMCTVDRTTIYYIILPITKIQSFN